MNRLRTKTAMPAVKAKSRIWIVLVQIGASDGDLTDADGNEVDEDDYGDAINDSADENNCIDSAVVSDKAAEYGFLSRDEASAFYDDAIKAFEAVGIDPDDFVLPPKQAPAGWEGEGGGPYGDED